MNTVHRNDVNITTEKRQYINLGHNLKIRVLYSISAYIEDQLHVDDVHVYIHYTVLIQTLIVLAVSLSAKDHVQCHVYIYVISALLSER